MSQYVVWYDSSEVGAPILNNTAGSLIGVLDACLVNGFNLKPITSLVVVGGVATATCNGHGYSGKYSQDIALAGCNTAALNGRKQLTYVDTNTFRFDATGVADQTATGTITAKRDALGWVKQFTGANKAIYKRSDPAATSMMLRIVDTGVAPASVVGTRAQMIETATDIDTITGAGPTVVKPTDGFGFWWSKGASNTTPKQWSLVGDGKFFTLHTQDSTTTLPTVNNVNGVGHQAFGDFASFKAGDAYNCYMQGGTWDQAGGYTYCYGMAHTSGYTAPPDVGSAIVCRSYSQAGGAVAVASATGYPGLSGQSYPKYPSPIDGGFSIIPGIVLIENLPAFGYPARGVIKGVAVVLSERPLSHLAIEPNVAGSGGRTYLNICISAPSGVGALMWDLTGPWS